MERQHPSAKIKSLSRPDSPYAETVRSAPRLGDFERIDLLPKPRGLPAGRELPLD
jgi:hypothetical protein